METIRDLIRSYFAMTGEEANSYWQGEFRTKLKKSMDAHGVKYVYDKDYNVLFVRTTRGVIRVPVFLSSQIEVKP